MTTLILVLDFLAIRILRKIRLRICLPLLQQKEPEAPAPVEAVEAAPVVEPIIEKRKHITEEIASHNATKDLLAAEETSHNITKVDSYFRAPSWFLA